MGTHPIFESDFDCLTEQCHKTSSKCAICDSKTSSSSMANRSRLGTITTKWSRIWRWFTSIVLKCKSQWNHKSERERAVKKQRKLHPNNNSHTVLLIIECLAFFSTKFLDFWLEANIFSKILLKSISYEKVVLVIYWIWKFSRKVNQTLQCFCVKLKLLKNNAIYNLSLPLYYFFTNCPFRHKTIVIIKKMFEISSCSGSLPDSWKLK